MTWFEALILGIIQGLTEFLPVSSSGHLEIGGVLLGLQSSNNLLFAVTVHFATALATVVVFRRDIGGLAVGLLEFKSNDSWKFAWILLISMIPVGIVGVFFQDEIEQFFTGNMLLVGAMLLVTGVLLTFSHFAKAGDRDVTPQRAFLIGLAQAVAILPGISRSGATISAALLLGVDRAKAARFSFLMVIIPIMGAALLKLIDYFKEPAASAISFSSLLVGFVSAFVFGYFACTWMVKLVTRGKLIFFAIYCGIIGTLAILSVIL